VTTGLVFLHQVAPAGARRQLWLEAGPAGRVRAPVVRRARQCST